MERVKMGQFKANIHGGGGGGGGDEDEEWEMGLPAGTDLAPLCQLLIPHGLASAFGITPQLNRTAEDVDRASEETFSSLQNRGEAHVPSSDMAAEEDVTGSNNSKKPRTTVDDATGHGGEAVAAMEEGEGESATGDPAVTRTTMSKRQRLVWTPELQRRFLDVIGHLGVKNAVPKTIMQMMNVEGLTRENVASHLQKYRIYIKQKQHGFFPDDATSSSSSSRGIHGGVGGFQQVGPPMISPPVPNLDRMGMQGHHHHHHHHHYHHHIHNGTDNHGRNKNNQLHGGRGLGIGSNPHIAQQNCFNKTEED